MLKSLRFLTRLIVVASAVLLSSKFAHAAEPAKTPFDPKYLATPNSASSFMDPQVSCYSCHQATDPNQAEMYRERGTLNRVTLIETARWRELDFHSQAVESLKTLRAKAMGDLLGYDVTKSTQCLNCHSGHQQIVEQASQPPQLSVPINALVKHGVSCQACHGPADRWETEHRGAKEKDADWWKKTSHEKYALGLLDIRHPRTRAQVCLSCHLGSSSEGKILTHDMYAAGHPPLGNFETETFAAAMPYHGVLIEDKIKNSPESHQDWYRADDFYRTRSVLTASIVALRMQVQLVLDEATWSLQTPATSTTGNAAKPAGGGHRAQWPELSFFNCASCHHELAAEGPRRDRATPAAPGRPMLRRWPTTLYEVAMRGAGIDAAGDVLQPLEQAMSRNPFGRANDVKTAAKAVAARLDAELETFESRPVDRAGAVKYLEAICTVGLSRPVDYEEGRQLAWAAKIIVRELKNSAETSSTPSAVVPSAATLERVEKTTAAFDLDLCLEFPAKQAKATTADAPKTVVGMPPYTPALLLAGSKSLEAQFQFDERAFRGRLEALRAALAPAP